MPHGSARGRKHPIKQEGWNKKISLPFIVLGLLALIVAGSYNFIHYILVQDKKTLITQDLGILSQYIQVINPQASTLLNNINTLVQGYKIPNENVLIQQRPIINEVRDQIRNQSQQLITSNPNYQRLIEFIDDISAYRDELLLYLGANVPKSYLVILQNSSEKRPNGGFFGSFAYVRVYGGKIRKIHIIDSYLGFKTMPRVALTPPARSDPIYEGKPFGWIASNKFGFTNIDGANLIKLYDATFNNKQSETFIPAELCQDICHRPIDGVIFVNTASLEKLAPGLQKKFWERQFTNASVDILRGADLPNKKEFYLSDSQKLFASSMTDIFKNFFLKFDDLSRSYNFGVYIPTISSGLNEALTTYHFTTIANNHTIYTWDTNRSYNKSDGFVTKSYRIKNKLGDTTIEGENNDQIDITSLSPGDYTLELYYRIHVPQAYRVYISQLEQQYGITLTDRERGILVLMPTVAPEDGIQRLWETKGQLYFPQNVLIHSISGDYGHHYFESPSGPGVDYILGTTDNDSSRSVEVSFTLQ